LGLYLSKKIIEAHKGRVWVDSEGPGKGSIFSVELQDSK
jgi:signal transduction histidine kinase